MLHSQSRLRQHLMPCIACLSTRSLRSRDVCLCPLRTIIANTVCLHSLCLWSALTCQGFHNASIVYLVHKMSEISNPMVNRAKNTPIESVFFCCGGPKGIRTPDLRIANASRYQLCYGPMQCHIILHHFFDIFKRLTTIFQTQKNNSQYLQQKTQPMLYLISSGLRQYEQHVVLKLLFAINAIASFHICLCPLRSIKTNARLVASRLILESGQRHFASLKQMRGLLPRACFSLHLWWRCGGDCRKPQAFVIVERQVHLW